MFEEYYKQYFWSIVFHFHGKGISIEFSQDLAQEVFCIALRDFDAYDPQKSSFKRWLLKLAFDNNIKPKRKMIPFSQIVLGDEMTVEDLSSDDVLWASTIHEDIDAKIAIESLPERDKTIVSKFLEGYTQSEIAGQVGLSQQRISQILQGFLSSLVNCKN